MKILLSAFCCFPGYSLFVRLQFIDLQEYSIVFFSNKMLRRKAFFLNTSKGSLDQAEKQSGMHM